MAETGVTKLLADCMLWLCSLEIKPAPFLLDENPSLLALFVEKGLLLFSRVHSVGDIGVAVSRDNLVFPFLGVRGGAATSQENSAYGSRDETFESFVHSITRSSWSQS